MNAIQKDTERMQREIEAMVREAPLEQHLTIVRELATELVAERRLADALAEALEHAYTALHSGDTVVTMPVGAMVFIARTMERHAAAREAK